MFLNKKKKKKLGDKIYMSLFFNPLQHRSLDTTSRDNKNYKKLC
jgi:hypothetical protein